MIYLFFIIIFSSIIFFFTLKKILINISLKKINKIKFLFLYFSLFIFAVTIISVVYYSIGSPNLSGSKLLQIKLKKEEIAIENAEDFKNAKKEIEILKKMLDTQPNNINILLAIASNAAIIQDIKTEINSLKRILETKPLPKIKSLLAQAYLRKDNSIVSLKLKILVEEILTEEPKDPAANYILGLYFKQNGELIKSKEIFLNIFNKLDENHPWKLIYKDQLNIK